MSRRAICGSGVAKSAQCRLLAALDPLWKAMQASHGCWMKCTWRAAGPGGQINRRTHNNCTCPCFYADKVSFSMEFERFEQKKHARGRLLASSHHLYSYAQHMCGSALTKSTTPGRCGSASFVLHAKFARRRRSTHLPPTIDTCAVSKAEFLRANATVCIDKSCVVLEYHARACCQARRWREAKV